MAQKTINELVKDLIGYYNDLIQFNTHYYIHKTNIENYQKDNIGGYWDSNIEYESKKMAEFKKDIDILAPMIAIIDKELMERTAKIQDIELFRKHWEALGKISVNDNDEIEQEFLGFPAGTNKLEIWSHLENICNMSIGKYLEKLPQ